MKICVLFGSFNPLTNAHITALLTAVNTIDADKGLFVATNGHFAPFYREFGTYTAE